MASHSRPSSLQEPIARFTSLLSQTVVVFAGLLFMLFLTGGQPSALVLSLSVIAGIAFVAWAESRREAKNRNVSTRLPALIQRQGHVPDITFYPSNAGTNENFPLIAPFSSQRKDEKTNILSILLQGAEIWNQWRKENLPDYVGPYQINLSFANLSETDLSGADLSGVYLYRANLSRANLTDAILCEASFHRANLTEANLSGADLSRAYLRAVNLSEANLSGAGISGADLRSGNLIKANLSEAALRSANFSEAILYGADLHKANLHGANFYRADLSAADFTGATLRETALEDAAFVTRTIFSDEQRISPELKTLLQERGAIFVDSSDSTIPIGK